MYKLPNRFWSKRVAMHIGNYIGKFIEVDPSSFKGVRRAYMRIRVEINIRNPLPKLMNISRIGGD